MRIREGRKFPRIRQSGGLPSGSENHVPLLAAARATPSVGSGAVAGGRRPIFATAFFLRSPTRCRYEPRAEFHPSLPVFRSEFAALADPEGFLTTGRPFGKPVLFGSPAAAPSPVFRSQAASGRQERSFASRGRQFPGPHPAIIFAVGNATRGSASMATVGRARRTPFEKAPTGRRVRAAAANAACKVVGRSTGTGSRSRPIGRAVQPGH